ncbi:MAG: hypothetical protein ACRDV1_13990, partial [Actinomycetes bacterium]
MTDDGRPPPPSLRDRWRDLRLSSLRHRRLLSAGLLAGSVALALHALSPPSAATVPVLAAGHDLAGGTTVREG